MSTSAQLLPVLEQWRSTVGGANVLERRPASERYGASTEGGGSGVLGAVLPGSEAEVAEVVRIAQAARVPIYPLSTGHNWGYGTARPVVDSVILDLSRMDRIGDFDANLGLVSVQPGVTQAGLAKFLDARGARFLVPVTGAGPSCSLLGNALERGWGIIPICDHFQAVMRIRAVLPSGELYASAFSSLGAEAAGRAHKWGVGPYLDGLFSQGAFGVVTEMTLALASTPEAVEGFVFGVDRDDELEEAVESVRLLLRSIGGIAGAVNLMSPHRMLAAAMPYPAERRGPDGTIPPNVLDELARFHKILPWTGLGALYGPREMVRVAGRLIRSTLGRRFSRLRFFSRPRLRRLVGLARHLPGGAGHRLRGQLDTLSEIMTLLEGRPSEISLSLAYWKSPKRPERGLDPAADGCGLLWYAPLIPLEGKVIRSYVQAVRSICKEHGLEPVISFTIFSERSLDCTVPLIFDPKVPAQVERAHACYRALFEAGKRIGCVPYRLGTQQMGLMVNPDDPFWRTVQQLKRAVDPADILAAGRYSPIAPP